MQLSSGFFLFVWVFFIFISSTPYLKLFTKKKTREKGEGGDGNKPFLQSFSPACVRAKEEGALLALSPSA